MSDEKYVFINDPLQKGNSKSREFFYEQKDSNHYRLFSRGLDGVSDTKDDVYPTLNINDSNKIGWVK